MIKHLEMDDVEEGMVSELSSELLVEKHTPELQEIVAEYKDSINMELYGYVKDILAEREPIPSNISLQDIKDISRLSYVLANFDSAETSHNVSRRYKDSDGRPAHQVVLKKRVNGNYYVIEAVCDNKKKTSYITSAYLTKT